MSAWKGSQGSQRGVYENKGIKAPQISRGRVISSLLSRFEEPKPQEGLVDSIVQEKNAFSPSSNKSRRKSLTLSHWNETASIKDLSSKFESPSSPLVVAHDSPRPSPPPAHAPSSPVEPVGMGLAERKKLFLSPQRAAPAAASPQPAPSDGSVKPVRDMVANIESGRATLNTSRGGSRRSRSRRGSRPPPQNPEAMAAAKSLRASMPPLSTGDGFLSVPGAAPHSPKSPERALADTSSPRRGFPGRALSSSPRVAASAENSYETDGGSTGAIPPEPAKEEASASPRRPFPGRRAAAAAAKEEKKDARASSPLVSPRVPEEPTEPTSSTTESESASRAGEVLEPAQASDMEPMDDMMAIEQGENEPTPSQEAGPKEEDAPPSSDLILSSSSIEGGQATSTPPLAQEDATRVESTGEPHTQEDENKAEEGEEEKDDDDASQAMPPPSSPSPSGEGLEDTVLSPRDQKSLDEDDERLHHMALPSLPPTEDSSPSLDDTDDANANATTDDDNDGHVEDVNEEEKEKEATGVSSTHKEEEEAEEEEGDHDTDSAPPTPSQAEEDDEEEEEEEEEEEDEEEDDELEEDAPQPLPSSSSPTPTTLSSSPSSLGEGGNQRAPLTPPLPSDCPTDLPPAPPKESHGSSLDELEGLPTIGNGSGNLLLDDNDEGPITLEKYLLRVRSIVDISPHLELMNQGIDDDDIEMLFDALEETGKIKRIRTISLNGNDFEGRGADRLAAVLSKNYPISSVDLAWNLIGPEGAQVLGEALVANTTLEHLNVDGNDLGRDGAMALAQSLQGNSMLKRLEIKDNSIGDYGAACMAMAVASHPTLEFLDMTCNGISSAGAEQIAKHLIGDISGEGEAKKQPHLHTLVLNSNPLGDRGATFLANALTESTHLHSLQIRACDIHADGIRALVDVLKEAQFLHLTELDLNMNTQTVHSEIALNDLLMQHENLYVEWRDHNSEHVWEAEEIQVIIEHYGFSQILGNILHGVSLAPLIENHVLLGFIDISDMEVAHKFVNEAFSPPLFEAGLQTVTHMIRRGLPAAEADDFDEYEGEDLYLDENDEPLEELSPLVQVLYEWMPKLVDMLKEEPEPVATSSGNILPFGLRRMMILELVIALMDEEGSVVFNQLLVDLLMPTIVLNLMVQYERNNLLHKQVQLYVRVSLRTEALRVNLFEDTHILDFVLHYCQQEWNKPLAERAAYSGYLALIVEDILTFEFDEAVCGFIDDHDEFNDFIEGLYVQYKKEAVSSIAPPPL